MTDRPRVLIEDWLPVHELGIESRRERAALSALPGLFYLHVWWARRPLVASAAIVLAGLLPSWTPELAEAFPVAKPLHSERMYRAWLLRLVGIWGDPTLARQRIDAARATGERFKGDAYSYKQAFRNSPSEYDIKLMHDVLRYTWGEELPLVADPTAGGGSIPFAASRLGIPTYANDLNGVAAAVLRAGVEIPAQFGLDLLPHLKRWGEILIDRVRERVKPYFPCDKGERITNYIFAHTVACPRTGRSVPLLTDWWLRRGSEKDVAVRPILDMNDVELRDLSFEIIRGRDLIDYDASKGVVSRGSAVSIYDHLAIDGSYIKAEAQAGRMGQTLYAVVIRTPDGRQDFRAPNQKDIDALEAAGKEIERVRPDWEARGVLPVEEFPPPIPKHDIRPYGITRWQDFFTPRQLLVHGTFIDEFFRLIPEVYGDLGRELGGAVLAELAIMQGKALNWNARASSWDVGKQRMRSVFDRHDFSFKWTFAEMEGSEDVYGWPLRQAIKSYEEISSFYEVSGTSLTSPRLRRDISITQGNAANLESLQGRSVAHLCIDPPYYDNVMYAELADFFYVWEKRTLGKVMPGFVVDELTDKDNEAVANYGRFVSMGVRKAALADADYEAKMTAIFAECGRVLRDDGVLTVMFTHKRAEAWDTLGMGLLQAGFTIETSWPINTESESSSHQARKNAAASTIMLVCRKRLDDGDARQVFFEDIEAEVRRQAREALERFTDAGLSGVDLLLSTYGPALSVISQHWPVYSSAAAEDGSAQLLRPEQALDAARSEVVRLQRSRLIGHPANLDALTDFTLIAWDNFHAAEFPYDEARRLALAVGGLDIAELQDAKILAAKSGTVRMLPPHERVRRGDAEQPGVRPTAERFTEVIDAVHTVMYVADVDGLTAAKALMDRLELARDSGFLDCVQGLVNAIPRTKVKGDWVFPEAAVLDRLVSAYLPDISLPADPTPEPAYVQADMLDEVQD